MMVSLGLFEQRDRLATLPLLRQTQALLGHLRVVSTLCACAQ
jgi:hypothetical protein